MAYLDEQLELIEELKQISRGYGNELGELPTQLDMLGHYSYIIFKPQTDEEIAQLDSLVEELDYYNGDVTFEPPFIKGEKYILVYDYDGWDIEDITMLSLKYIEDITRWYESI